MPEWNTLTDDERQRICDAVMIDDESLAWQIAVSVYAVARKVVNDR
jgi:hypothetical protein